MPPLFKHKSLHRKALALLCLFVFQCRRLSAAGPYTVNTNIDAAGFETFRQAITDADATPGTNTINWTTGLFGTIGLVGDLPIINDGTTIDVTAAGSTVIIANGYLMPSAGRSRS